MALLFVVIVATSCHRGTASDDQDMATPEHAMAGTPSRLGPLDGLGNAR